MQWNRDALSDEPDVAAIETRPARQWPGWVVRALIALGVVAAAVFVLWRMTADQARAEYQQVRMVSKYVAEIDVLATNLTRGELYALPRLTDREGFAIDTPRVRLDERRQEIVTTRVTIEDCALAADHASDRVDLKLLVGPHTGNRDTIEVRGELPPWSELMPPVCEDSPDSGVASVADVHVVRAQPGEAEVEVTIQNTGGRPLTYVRATVPQEIGRLSADAPEPDGPLAPGKTAEFELRVHRSGCTASGDGPAIATMAFLADQELAVQLDESWSNLLGSCGDDLLPFGG